MTKSVPSRYIDDIPSALSGHPFPNIRQVCNALDHARPGMGTEGVPQHRRVEHTDVDMIATDYLEAFRTRDDVSAEDFDWAVNRAGLHLLNGELTSRHPETT